MSDAKAPTAPSREALDAAVDGDTLEVVFQPIVSLPDEGGAGFEALARWAHLGGAPSDDVFAYATRTGRAGELERNNRVRTPDRRSMPLWARR